MNILKGKALVIVLGLVALLVESCAAFFSVYGLSKFFAGASTAVIFMRSLEIAKVVIASYLYRKWSRINLLMKSYLTFAVVILVGITSMGIYGFLSNAFQRSTLQLDTENAQIQLYESELDRLKADKVFAQDEKQQLLSQMQVELDGLKGRSDSTNYLLIRKRQYQTRASFKPQLDAKETEIQNINTRMTEYTEKLGSAQVEMVTTGVDVGPIIFVARFFDVNAETVAQYLVIIFIAVFDPLAVVLVIATNKAWMDYRMDTKGEVVEVKKKKVKPPKKSLLPEFLHKEEPPKKEPIPHDSASNETIMHSELYKDSGGIPKVKS